MLRTQEKPRRRETQEKTNLKPGGGETTETHEKITRKTMTKPWENKKENQVKIKMKNQEKGKRKTKGEKPIKPQENQEDIKINTREKGSFQLAIQMFVPHSNSLGPRR